jgi:hypothetical protein
MTSEQIELVWELIEASWRRREDRVSELIAEFLTTLSGGNQREMVLRAQGDVVRRKAMDASA